MPETAPYLYSLILSYEKKADFIAANGPGLKTNSKQQTKGFFFS